MSNLCDLLPSLVGLLIILLTGRLTGELDASEPAGDDRTLVEHMTTKPPFNGGGLATIEYRPSDQEQPFFAMLDAAESKTGGLSGDYDFSNKNGAYVGWFGIVRKVSEYATSGRSTLVVEHKYFDGFTDSHIQALSFNGSGDFLAILRGTGHRIRVLTLVKVYGKVSKSGRDKLPQIDADFVRNWHWGTFTFLAAHGAQRGSEKWRKLNQVDLDDIYDPYPDDAYYEKRLGKRSEDAQRRQVFRRLALEAAREAGLPADGLSGDGDRQKPSANKPSDRVDSQTLRDRARRAATPAGPSVESVVDSLVDALLKKDLAALKDALKTAAKLDAEGIAAAVLAEALMYEKEDVRILAVEMLGERGFAAKATVPALIAALKDECKYVRKHAASSLGYIGPEAQRAVPALLVTLGDEDPYVRSSACEALGWINTQAKYVVPALIAAMNDGDSYVRWQAVGSLGQFAGATSAAGPLREALLHHEDTSVRWNAAEALAAVDSEGEISIPALSQALKDSNRTVRRFAAMGLGTLGSKARTAAPLLLEALNDKDTGVRVAAAGALWKVEQNVQAAVPVLAQVLEQDKGITMLWAANAIAPIGPEAKDAVGALRKMVSRAPETWRSGGVRALGNIGPGASAAVPDLVELLGGKDREMRAYAAGALWKINRYPQAIPTIIEVLKNPPYDMPYAAVVTLGEIGPPAREAVPDLIKTLSHRDLLVRKEAARALKRIDPNSMPIPANE